MDTLHDRQDLARASTQTDHKDRSPSRQERICPDELFKLYKHAAMMLRAHAELDGVNGLQFLATPRGILPIEEMPGAGRLAEANDGPLGHWMRTIREEGYASKSPAVRQALEERTNLAHTKGFKAHLRKIRKNRAVIRQEEALEKGLDRHLALHTEPLIRTAPASRRRAGFLLRRPKWKVFAKCQIADQGVSDRR